MTLDLMTRKQVAIAAVRKASAVCKGVQDRLISPETIEKKDKSPVTVADYASQAIICSMLADAFPDDVVVGEEDAAELRQDDQAHVRTAVMDQVQAVSDNCVDEQTVLSWIDLGGANADTDAYWTLDPIDGTKGFLRKEQYAVALALLEKGEVVLGILGCPNLNGGQLLVAIKGQGAEILPLWDSEETQGTPIKVSDITDTAAACFCESVESGHSDHSQSAQIAKLLNITKDSVRLDSQAKYATIAKGDAQIYLRLPTSETYREKIWDHAAGKLVVEEAGGTVTDVAGNPLNFTHGRKLEQNRGVIATCGPIHNKVVEVVQQVLKG
ncbi:MAG TPA: 3'(2'),5'-bisphosphate nucleotidase [Phycisphaerales bacterium]|nr:3'(2'),5'-bisphosphate nucleotidase [Phycisphaerales bacterium]HCD35120.1 3'(2'),5'-bisphosphate nucleotidase [Phycisphaerales bacterium]|tara:strand:+ start:75629 stop:76606 length:978 start_codon:yes stop_codon:yes gene_type:complete